MGGRGKSSARQATAVDRAVGERIRVRRRQLRMTQADLGTAIGLSFKQVRKYEQGQNRIGAGMLYIVAQVLGLRVRDFFAGLEEIDSVPDIPVGEAEALAVEFQRIRPPARRRAFENLVKAIADNEALQAHWARR